MRRMTLREALLSSAIGIYSLGLPRTRQTVYVGRTAVRIGTRLSEHLHHTGDEHAHKLSGWLRRQWPGGADAVEVRIYNAWEIGAHLRPLAHKALGPEAAERALKEHLRPLIGSGGGEGPGPQQLSLPTEPLPKKVDREGN